MLFVGMEKPCVLALYMELAHRNEARTAPRTFALGVVLCSLFFGFQEEKEMKLYYLIHFQMSCHALGNMAAIRFALSQINSRSKHNVIAFRI